MERTTLDMLGTEVLGASPIMHPLDLIASHRYIRMRPKVLRRLLEYDSDIRSELFAGSTAHCWIFKWNDRLDNWILQLRLLETGYPPPDAPDSRGKGGGTLN